MSPSKGASEPGQTGATWVLGWWPRHNGLHKPATAAAAAAAQQLPARRAGAEEGIGLWYLAWPRIQGLAESGDGTHNVCQCPAAGRQVVCVSTGAQEWVGGGVATGWLCLDSAEVQKIAEGMIETTHS